MHITPDVLPHADWPYLDILVRLALATALGLLIGLERERRTSIAFSLSFVWRSGNRLLLSRLAIGMVVVAVAGLAGTVLWKYVQPLLKPWL